MNVMPTINYTIDYIVTIASKSYAFDSPLNSLGIAIDRRLTTPSTLTEYNLEICSRLLASVASRIHRRKL